MPELLIDRLLRHEGMRLKPYKDNLGNDTIGAGHLLSNGISIKVAMQILHEDIDNAKAQVNAKFDFINNLSQTRKDVLYEMCFQLGINRILFFKKMIYAIEQGDYETAANEMLDSLWHKQTPKRCEELSQLMRNG